MKALIASSHQPRYHMLKTTPRESTSKKRTSSGYRKLLSVLISAPVIIGAPSTFTQGSRRCSPLSAHRSPCHQDQVSGLTVARLAAHLAELFDHKPPRGRAVAGLGVQEPFIAGAASCIGGVCRTVTDHHHRPTGCQPVA